MSDTQSYEPIVPSEGLSIPNLKTILSRFVWKYWYLYITLPIVGAVIAFLILRYEVPIFRVQTKLLLKSEATNSEINEKAIFQGMDIPVISKNLENEMQILRSGSLMERVIDSLNLDQKFYQVGRVQNTEIYGSTPLRIDTLHINKNFNELTFYLRPLSSDVFLFGTDLDNMSEQIFELPFETPEGSFSISFSDKQTHIGRDFMIRLVDKQRLARDLASRFFIRPSGSSDLLLLTITDEIPSRGVDFLNMLTKIYQQDAVVYLNTVNRNTMDWVEKRISTVQSQLDDLEDSEERYLLNEDMPVSLDVSTQKALDEEAQIAAELRVLRMNRAILEDYRSNLQNVLDKISYLPDGLLKNWPELEARVGTINNLIQERESKLVSGTSLNPIIEELGNRILQLKTDLFTDVRLRIKTLYDNIQDKDKRQKEVSVTIYKTPQRERAIRNISRQKLSVEVIYGQLLQRREEIDLSIAVASSNVRVIEQARSTGVIQKNPTSLYIMALGLGLICTLFIIALLELLNDKVQSEDEAKQLSGLPLLGIIPLNKTAEKLVFEQNSHSVISEMIRLLRTNLQYVMPGKSKGAFLITSSTSGEGKTFVAINLAFALASTKKKVLVIDLDLRRPKLGEYLESDPNLPGVSNYLVGKKSLEEIIHKHKKSEYFHFIPAGPIPPNPAELLLTDQVNELITTCKEHFDFILLDSPPLGLVADSFLLNKYVDGTLLIARQNHTKKGMLKYIRDNKAQNRIKNPHLVYNGVKKSGQYGYRYGNGYYTD